MAEIGLVVDFFSVEGDKDYLTKLREDSLQMFFMDHTHIGELTLPAPFQVARIPWSGRAAAAAGPLLCLLFVPIDFRCSSTSASHDFKSAQKIDDMVPEQVFRNKGGPNFGFSAAGSW